MQIFSLVARSLTFLGFVAASSALGSEQLWKTQVPGSPALPTFSSDGELFVATTLSGQVYVWRSADGTMLSTIDIGMRMRPHVEILPGSHVGAIGTANGCV